MPKRIEPPAVPCPICGLKLVPSADGTIPHHLVFPMTGRPAPEPSNWTKKCPGIGQKVGKAA